MVLKFKNFLKIYYFSHKFSKKGTLRGIDFRILRYPDQQRIPVLFFARVPSPRMGAYRIVERNL